MLRFVPQPPDWRLDWSAIRNAVPEIEALEGCPQDPRYHAEGDVSTHTRRVLEALAGLDGFRTLSTSDRDVLFWAALLHDVGKPASTRRLDDGRIISPGHARRGASIARRLLWHEDTPFAARERVVQLVLHHALPLWAAEREDGPRRIVLASQAVRCDLLALLAEADVRGREAPDIPALLERVELFVELCRDEGCLDGPRRFGSEHARFLYARERWPHVDFPPHEDFGSEVVLMSGLPGAGKDTWLAEHQPDLPVISLDQIRQELDIAATGNQGRVIQTARERAREQLRRGEPFAWNATNVSRRLRDGCVGLFDDYRARVRIVYLEASPDRLAEQNRGRPEAVPAEVLERLIQRWQVPEPSEAHRLEYWVDGRRQNPWPG